MARASGAPAGRAASRWIDALAWITARGAARCVALAVCALPIVVARRSSGWPRPADALVAIRPSSLAPLAAEEHMRALFGGRSGQWIVLTADADEERARARADRVAEALEPLRARRHIDGFDALTTLAPSATTQRARLAERDALDLPVARARSRAALRDAGFDPQAARRRSTLSRTRRTTR